MAYAFSLRCLGGPSLFTAAGEQVRFRTRKHFALLIRMALDPGKQFTRDYLADLLWPDAAPKLANHSLAQGLSVIKAKIAREAVVIQRATVGLAAGWVDVDVKHLSDGGATIDGPFLEAFEIAGARPFEEWKDEYRAGLIPQLRDCLVRQMDAARRIGDFASVEQRAVRLRELDPLAEEGIRGIMEARAWASDRSGALKTFARYEELLADELDAKPSVDLIRMADLLRDGRRSASRPVAAGEPPERIDRRFEPETLIGREREFSVLYDAWLEARRKNPRIVVVTSDPGVGKTTLVNAFAATCQMDGAVVARAQAYDAERELPFAVLGELVKQLAAQRAIGGADPEALSELTRISGEILRQFPGVPKPVEWSPELTPLRIADAFLKTVLSTADDSPVLLVIDDIHAADNASTAILHSVARKLTDSRAMLIFAGRTSELRFSSAPRALASDLSISGKQMLELEVLPAEPAQKLMERLVSSDCRSDLPVSRILRASGGNPLAIELLTREWTDHGVASLLHDLEALDTQPVPAIGIPRAIGVVFDLQSRRLEPSLRASLDLAAILGRRLTEVTLYRAIDLTPGQAAEALSRLHDEGYLRDIRGDLEFRNELIRAQAYYAVTSTTRKHLHERVAKILSQEHPERDETVSLEVAWHYFRGGDFNSAVPFALHGAEAVLAVGAPHGAEEILTAIIECSDRQAHSKEILLLLARALLDQSKAEPAFPIIEKLANCVDLTKYEQAQIAMLRATAEFASNRNPGVKYCEAAKSALVAARNSGDAELTARALFECARAGTEEGLTELVEVAERGVEELSTHPGFCSMPMTTLTKAYCRVFYSDLRGALDCLESTPAIRSLTANLAQSAFVHSGIGLTNHFLGRFDVAYEAYRTALELLQKVGDDARVSVMAANLCTLQMHRGLYQDSIRYGLMSVKLGEASSCSTLLIGYTNLMDPYMLLGHVAEAEACLEKARKWLLPERRWKLRFTFLLEAASFALIQGNHSLALDLLAQLESVASGRDEAIPMPGSYWKMRVFRNARLGNSQEAHDIVERFSGLWRGKCPVYYLDMVAARAWLESQEQGQVSEETMSELQVFDEIGATGRKALLTLQGFLPSMDQPSRRLVGAV